MEPSNDNSNNVSVFVQQNGKRVLLCLLNEAIGMTQMPLNITLFPGLNLIVEVIGKGTVHMIGQTKSDGLDLLL